VSFIFNLKNAELQSSYVCFNLRFIGSLIVLFASFLAVFGRDSLTSGEAGLSLSYALGVSFGLDFSVYVFLEFIR